MDHINIHSNFNNLPNRNVLIVSLSIVVLLVKVHRFDNKYIYVSQNNIMLNNIKKILNK